MGLNSTVVLTLILLTLMLGAGFSSASWGYIVGREALKGITQPDTRPTNNLTGSKSNLNHRVALKLLKEKDVLATVKKRMEGGGNAETKKTDTKKTSVEGQSKPSPDPNKSQAKFPIVSRDRQVTLEVTDARKRGTSLLLEVSIKNDSSKPVRFLYSFLNVTDDQGRALSASTDDLPEELPANGNAYYGTISIPTALLDNAKEISLVLTDYPDQKLQLQLSGIPVIK